MHLVLTALLAAATTAPAQAGERTRYFELINRAHDSVISLAVAPAGDGVFRDVPLRSALRGGGGAATVEIAGGGCRYDLRLQFRNGRSVVYRDFDTCRHDGLRIRKLPPPMERVSGSPDR